MSDALREVASTIFFALHAVYDDADVAESTKVLREAVERNLVRDPEAREILLEIADHALPPPAQPRYVVESGNVVRLLRP
jgi:hypothetical protein